MASSEDDFYNAKEGCTVCGSQAYAYVLKTFTHKVCFTCYGEEKERNQKIIRSLPDVDVIEAPLGYSFIMTRGFADADKGKEYLKWLWDLPIAFTE